MPVSSFMAPSSLTLGLMHMNAAQPMQKEAAVSHKPEPNQSHFITFDYTLKATSV